MEKTSSFDPCFTSGQYLRFLNFSRDEGEVKRAFESVRSAIQNSTVPKAEIETLLAERNWRPHLVAAIAMLLDKNVRPPVQSLWAAIDLPSWVAPQLTVTAFRIDPAFEEQARKRILSEDTRPKTMAALARLYALGVKLDHEVLESIERGPAKALIALDTDNGGGIAVDWLATINQYIPAST